MNAVHTIRVVDLGFAVIRIKRERFVGGIHTTLTLMTPALAEDVFQPAQSAEAYFVGQEKIDVLVKALTDPLPDETKVQS